MNAVLDKKVKESIKDIPEIGDLTKIFFYVKNHNVNFQYLNLLKELTNLKDDIISNWLNINTRTFRNYKKSDVVLKDNTKEHIVLLISLYKHGIEVFDSIENFDKWLITENFLLDKKAPMDFLDTVSGLKFIDDRLTAIEYGDNV
ncbi:MbcA/ParS/Xre antitoxin family protein [Flavobacterium aquiphilum]|uniref:MbcA/ParS/Xre antitoxin family protein n=1 Tax=Flavobacterium aquiphilum TaxID=3003261 RepID=UPI00247FACE9|nr:MbcA/ParS/Xre antitoxin family protein [Flavobacterium aquiphilum]